MAEKNKKLYKSAIIDPPWDLWQRGRGNRSAESHYPLMKLEDIKNIKIGDVMEPDSFIYLWVTNNVLISGQFKEVLDAWGYTPVSILTWVKHSGRLGLGNFMRNVTEHMLVAKRGNPEVKFHGQPNILWAPQQEHSHKPEEAHEIVRRFSDGPYLEVFARRPYPGFDIAGNEVVSDVQIEGIDTPRLSDKAKEA